VSILSYTSVSELFKITNDTLEHLLDSPQPTRICLQIANKTVALPVFENFLKEHPDDDHKLKYRRVMALTLYRAKKYKRCLSYMTNYLVY
jgi:hypothetical protein